MSNPMRQILKMCRTLYYFYVKISKKGGGKLWQIFDRIYDRASYIFYAKDSLGSQFSWTQQGGNFDEAVRGVKYAVRYK